VNRHAALVLGAMILSGAALVLVLDGPPDQADCQSVQTTDQGVICTTSDGTQLDLTIR
jgi:hypothetical protein